MTLARLTQQDGNPIYVNPAHIAWVMPRGEQTDIVMINTYLLGMTQGIGGNQPISFGVIVVQESLNTTLAALGVGVLIPA